MPAEERPGEVRVVDASAVAALLFGEPRADEVVDRLRGGALVAALDRAASPPGT
jgi:uncharacterized protein with PIN domain